MSSARVTLHVYDLGQGQLHAVGSHWAGAFHAAVEVYGVEYSFGLNPQPGSTGVFSNEPRRCTMHTYRESVPMGVTTASEPEVHALLLRMRAEWAGPSYDLLHRNCCHFSDALCKELGVGAAPPWLNRAANTGAGIVDEVANLAGEARRAGEMLQPVLDEVGELAVDVMAKVSDTNLAQRMWSASTRATVQFSAANKKLVESPAFRMACMAAYDRVIANPDRPGLCPLAAELAAHVVSKRNRAGQC